MAVYRHVEGGGCFIYLPCSSVCSVVNNGEWLVAMGEGSDLPGRSIRLSCHLAFPFSVFRGCFHSQDRILFKKSSPETAEFILRHYGQEFSDIFYFRMWVIAVPFQVRPHPENAPIVISPDIGCPGNRRLNPLAADVSPNFNQLHVLVADPIGEVQFIPDLFWRAIHGDVLTQYGNDSIQLTLTECHSSSPLFFTCV